MVRKMVLDNDLNANVSERCVAVNKSASGSYIIASALERVDVLCFICFLEFPCA